MPISIKDVVNAAAGAAVQPGQVVQFKEGQVPEGYAQISGPSIPPDATGIYVLDNLLARTSRTFSVVRLVSTASKLFAVGSETSAYPAVYELGGDLSYKGVTSSVPSAYSTSIPRLIPLSDGNLLSVGGGTSNEYGVKTFRYNVASNSWTALANKITNAYQSYVHGAQAGNGVVYCTGYTAGVILDAYTPSTNTWAENVDSLPIDRSNLIGVCTLPSGKLFFAFTTAQYVFNPSAQVGSRWSQVGSLAISSSPYFYYTGMLATAAGARLYTLGSINGSSGTLTVDYIESSNSIVQSVHPCDAAYTTYQLSCVLNPYNGAVVIRPVNSGRTVYQHYQNYTPAAKVDAVKL